MRKFITLVEGDLVCNIPKGMTNGELIQALFPEVKVEIYGFLVRCVFIEHEFTTTLEWWNSFYIGEEKPNE